MIDIHNHVLVGVDDGPSSMEDAIQLLQQAEQQGITNIIATPHHRVADYYNDKEIVYEKIDTLKREMESKGININLHPGQEIRIHNNISSSIKTDEDITLNHSKYVLVELPFSETPPFLKTEIFDIQMNGYIPIIAHPERCKPLVKHPDELYQLIEGGALSQVTASSVTGDLGENLQETSLKMIENHLTHFIASDAHHVERRPFLLKEAYKVIERELGEDYVNWLKNNAEQVLTNQEVKVRIPSKISTHYTKKKRRKKFFNLF